MSKDDGYSLIRNMGILGTLYPDIYESYGRFFFDQLLCVQIYNEYIRYNRDDIWNPGYTGYIIPLDKLKKDEPGLAQQYGLLSQTQTTNMQELFGKALPPVDVPPPSTKMSVTLFIKTGSMMGHRMDFMQKTWMQDGIYERCSKHKHRVFDGKKGGPR